jgi:predicted nucleic acid-binding protein
MNRTYVLDANAVLNLVEDAGGAERVEHICQDATHQGVPLLMSVANWGEVFYYMWQRHGEEKARRTIGNLSRLPLDLVAVDLPQVLKAGEIKAVHKIPYVDCLAAALAETRQAVLVTSDRDFEKLGPRVQVLWLVRS